MAWRRIGTVPREADEALPWLYGVARNVLANEQRGRRRGGRLAARLGRSAPLAVADHARGVVEGLAVRQVLATLSARDQETLQLVGWDGLDAADRRTGMRIRDEAAHDTTVEEARVRQLLGACDPFPPAHGRDGDPALGERGQEVLARILATDPLSVKARRGTAWRPGRRWVVAALAAGVLGGAGLGAQAAGIIPDGVIWGLNRGSDDPGSEGMEPDISRARLLFEGQAPDGTGLEYWSAPNPSGGECTYLRVIDPGGGTEDGETECWRGSGVAPSPLWTTVNTTVLSDWTSFYGHVPPSAVSVRLTYRDGESYGPIRVDAHGYFLAFFPADDRGVYDWTPYTAQALDADGRVVAVERSDG